MSIKVDIDTRKLLKLNETAKNRAKVEIGNMATGEMALRAPVKTGALRNSIGYETADEGNASIPLPLVTDDNMVRVGTAIVYAAKNEYEYGNAFARPSIPDIQRNAVRIIEDNYRRSLNQL